MESPKTHQLSNRGTAHSSADIPIIAQPSAAKALKYYEDVIKNKLGLSLVTSSDKPASSRPAGQLQKGAALHQGVLAPSRRASNDTHDNGVDILPVVHIHDPSQQNVVQAMRSAGAGGTAKRSTGKSDVGSNPSKVSTSVSPAACSIPQSGALTSKKVTCSLYGMRSHQWSIASALTSMLFLVIPASISACVGFVSIYTSKKAAEQQHKLGGPQAPVIVVMDDAPRDTADADGEDCSRIDSSTSDRPLSSCRNDPLTPAHGFVARLLALFKSPPACLVSGQPLHTCYSQQQV